MIHWADPTFTPHRRGNQVDVDAVVRELQANPGRYATVRTAVTYGIGAGDAYRRRGCHIVIRRNPTGGWDHYAAWPAPPVITEASVAPVTDLATFRTIGARKIGAA